MALALSAEVNADNRGGRGRVELAVRLDKRRCVAVMDMDYELPFRTRREIAEQIAAAINGGSEP